MPTDPPQSEDPVSSRVLLMFVALAGAVVSYFTFADFLFEDSYITLRYATNLASGKGLVFQTGEAVLGTSAPFWAMFLALPIALGAQPELVLDVAFCFSLAALCYSGGRLLQRLGSPGAGVAFAVAVSLGVGRLHAYWGMETPLFTALLLGSWCWVLDRRYVLSGVCLGLACLTRYEGYAFGAAMALVLAARGSWPAVRTGGLALASVTLPWLGVAWRYYGNPVPLPAGAKAGHVTPLRYFERSYLDLPHDLFWPAESLGYVYPVGLVLSVLVGILGLVGVVHLVRSRQFVAGALPLGGLFVFAVLIAFAPGPLCTWHRAPLHMIGLLGALLGLSRLARGRFQGASWRKAGYAAAVAGLVAAVPIHEVASFQLRNTFQYVGREVAYPEIADFLRRTKLNETTVLTWEPGYLAFMSDARVIDVAGLVTPAPAFTAASTSRWDVGFPEEADLVLLRAPFRPEGFQLIFEGTMGSWLFARPRVLERYEGAIESYRAENAEGPEVRPITEGPVPLTPSYSGPPFVIGPPGTLTTLSPEQDMLALTAETPVLLLDAPSLEVEFQTATPNYVQLQLVVRGEVVLTSKQAPGDGGPSLTWDVSPWRDRTAKVRVLAVAGSGADASFGDVRAVE